MLLIPAIDLKEGQCVRLRQGRMDDSTVFSSDPVAMATHWKDQGARRLHIVDLDGAFAGMPRNGDLIRDMVAAMGDVPVQVGGGIRSEEIIEAYLAAGVQGLILGTQAINEPDFCTRWRRRTRVTLFWAWMLAAVWSQRKDGIRKQALEHWILSATCPSFL